MNLFINPLNIIIVGVFLTVFTGIFAYNGINLLPAKSIFELLIISVSLLSIIKLKKTFVLFSFLSLFYIAFGYLATFYFYNNFSLYDFFISYKSFFYLLLLTPFIGKKYITENSFKNFFLFLLLFFFLKYFFSRFIFEQPRPGLFVENNFELLFFLLLYLLVCLIDKKIFILKLCVVTIIVFASGSRSAILSLLFLIFMTYEKKLSFKTLIGFIIFAFIFSLSIIVLMQRLGGGIESIDRFVFFQYFLNDISNWSFSDYFFGNLPLTPMSANTCNGLSFYYTLFSQKNDGTCYSVVLHSYILRMIYDHGFFGLFFVLYFIFKALRTVGYNVKLCLTVLGLILINGLSVSAFNSVFCFLGLLFFLVVDRDFVVFAREKQTIRFRK